MPDTMIGALTGLTSLLGSASGPAFARFVAHACLELTDLRASIGRAALFEPDQAAGMMRMLHGIKAQAWLYGMEWLQHAAHEAETALESCCSGKDDDPGDIFAHLDERLANLSAGLQAVKVLAGRMLATAAYGDPEAVFQEFTGMQTRRAAQFARDLGKECVVNFIAGEIPAGADLQVLAALVPHMIRNAIDHGIESPEVRVAAGKPAAGQVLVTLDLVNGWFFGRIIDDGRGIIDSAVPSGSGVSGRGAGLAAVHAVLGRCEGLCNLETTGPAGTSFIFSWKQQGGGQQAVLVAA